MKYKALVIFTILFVTLFTLATVAASDVNDTDEVSEVTDDITQDVDILKATDTQIDENNSILNAAEEDTLSADEGSFRDLQDLIGGAEEGSTIYLDKDYAFKDTASVEFSKSITIDGRGHYLDGQRKDRIFDIVLAKDKRVVLKNITFKNGDVSWTSGGAIRCIGIEDNEGSIYITNCTFDNNHADDAGAVYVEFTGAYIENCRFTNNAADDHGGAIVYYSRGSYITDSYFENNRADDYGGAIYFMECDGFPKDQYVRDNRVLTSTFISNNGNYGGAIYSNARHEIIRSCTFYKNNADEDGGAIYGFTNGNGEDVIEDCLFVENSAEDYGGAVYFCEYGPNIYYSVFDKNTAETGKDLYIDFCSAYYDFPEHGPICISCIFLQRDSIYTDQFSFTGFHECWFPNGYNIQKGDEKDVLYMDNELNLKFEYVKNADSPSIVTGYFTFKQTSPDTFNVPLREFTIETTTGTINTNKINIGLNKNSFEYTPNYAFDEGEIKFKYRDYTYVFKFDQTPPDSFTALQSNVNQATDSLSLANDFSYSETRDSHIGSEGILIDKSLTINGNGHVINGNNRTAFKINNPSANVIFNDVIFVNCNIPINAINAQKITFNNCTFEENHENIIINSDCEFNDCQFIYNVAQNTSILYIAGDCVINGCQFLDNVAQNNLVIVIADDYVLNNTTFVNNVADESLILLNSTSNVEINGSLFTQNDADKIIHAKKALNKLNVANNIIINSKSEYEIYAESQPQECYLDYNWFGNTADNFNSPYKVNLDANTWYFLNMTLMHDYANISLNNVYDNVNKRIIKNSDYTLSNISIRLGCVNMSSSQGSIDFGDDGEIQINVYMLSKPAFLTASYENVNYTVNFTQKGEFDLLNDLISLADDNSTIVLDKDYTFTEGIDSVGGITIRATNITIDGNGHTINALGKSLIFTVSGERVTLKNLILVNGGNEEVGGYDGPVVWSGHDGVVDNCTFENNTGSLNGAITWTGQNGLIKDSLFKGNSARDGGALFLQGKNMTVTNTTFTNNRARSGGAIYVHVTEATVENCTFRYNTANDDGGAVYWDKKNGKISDCEFENNHAGSEGGAVYWNAANGVVTSSKFTLNNAEDGGAVYWNSQEGKISNCEFANNTATNGGAAYWNANYGTVNSSSFENNTATNGGAIFWHYDYGKVINSTFIKNTATNDGGAIYFNERGPFLDNEQESVEYSTFSENSAVNNGGAIYLAAEKSTIGNSEFSKNSAANGGAIHVTADESSIGNSTFIKNQAENGGALYASFDDGIISQLIFINNTASDKGSAIYTDKKTTPVNYCIFINNEGSSIYYKDTSWLGSELNADYNWFGNNITNYNAAPSVSEKVLCDYWYFMDMSMDGGIANIKLNNIYDKKHSRILTGQPYGLPQINLTLTNENLDVADNTTLNANGESQVAYIPKATQTSLTAHYDAAQITVNKNYLESTVTIGDKDEFTYGNVSIEFSVENPTTIEIIIINEDNETVFNTTTDERIVNPDLAVGTYTITITNIGIDHVLQSNATKTFTVNKLTPKISVVANDVTYPGDLIVNITSDVTGRYAVKVGDQQKEIDLIANVVGNVTFTGLSANEYIINVTYAETENYTSATNNTVKVNILKATPTIRVSAESVIYPGELLVNVVGDVDGKYSVKVGDQQKEIDLIANVVGNVTFTGLSVNEYIINVTYAETENHTGAINDTVEVSVLKATPTITVNAENTTYPNDVIVTINTNAEGKYNITVGNQTKEETLTVGTNTITFTGVKVGNYTITVKYGETENYTSAMNDTVKVSVLKNEAFEPEISAINTANETVITFTFPEDATGNVTVIVDGKQYNATVENGKAVITMLLIPLDSTVDFEYSGDENYPAKSKETGIANVTAIIKATDMTRGYNSGVDYQVTVVDGNGNPMAKKQVTFIINGNKYNATTNDEGIAVLNIKLAIGTYEVTTVNPLNNNNVTKTVKITTRITGNKNVDTYYAKNYAYKLLIIGDNGQAAGSNVAVKVTVNGKVQTLKTDKNGYITLKFTKAYLPKTYTVTAEYKGIKVTNKVKVKQILTLKKVKVKKSVKKLTLKATLKEGKKALKNKKVTFKFKGKKYKAKTNKKGIAKVTIKKSVLKKLKVGKKVKYQATYGKITKKVTVKVKK
jgi:predicted outer membrane repeat protein